MEFELFTLPNGIRVIHKPVESPVAHLGVILNAGSRDETDKESGIAHLIEHCIFKGTTRRKAFHVLSRLDDVGGDLNAFTTKEDTCIFASFTSQYYERAIELISDIIFNSSFPDKEIEKEKEVVVDEINSYKDNPSDEIFEEFEELMFADHPLGARITGTPESVKSFSRKQILSFVKKHYFRRDMVISSVGTINISKLKAMLTEHFGQFTMSAASNHRIPFADYKPFEKKVKRNNHQSHCIIGNLAYSLDHELKTPMFLLSNVLGGPGLNTRLNLNIREKYGFCYNIEASYTPYSDGGMFSVYLGTDDSYLDRSINLVHKELRKLRKERLGTLQLHKAKQQLLGQIAIAQETNANEMLSIGKSLLVYDKVDTFKEIRERIEAVSAEQMLTVANEVFDSGQLSTFVYELAEK
ncbi:MAG: insulinase family protein [Bacteroidetes bacterium]|nr:insulinase family protein [Bacteroidota bacterium]MBU1720527.1 insulinase family protein [Bacteroidota bacterium]